MDPTVAAFLRSWSFAPWTIAGCVLSVAIYYRGWRALRRRGGNQFLQSQLAAFVAGMVAILLAVCSPLDAFAGLLLSMHMAQHLLLLFVAAPLLCLAAPELPLVNGLPAPILEVWILPVLHAPAVRAVLHGVMHPAIAWLLATVALWLWHVPWLYELALESELWHRTEHACLLVTAVLFWWPVFQPVASHSVWPRAAMLPYLFLAGVQASGLCALLSFADHVLYPRYELVPRLWGLSALTDQAIAGAMMWVVGMAVYLVAMVWLVQRILYQPRSVVVATNELHSQMALQPSLRSPSFAWASAAGSVTGSPNLRPQSAMRANRVTVSVDSLERSAAGLRRASRNEIMTPAETANAAVVAPRGPVSFDLLEVPLLGTVLRWVYLRRVAQAVLCIVALLVVVDGFTGTQVAPLNLAGVLPWIHWRALVVVTLLLGGNLFCFACPFTLPRTLARRWLSPLWQWPRSLRSKGPAIVLLVAFFWAYEAWDLWQSPWWTAWIVVGYFLLAFTVDMLFRGASFCKYVCPIGQFQFVQSLVSPWEVRVRDATACVTCRTKDCLLGNATTGGCETQLFAPRKSDNMDCTFCLDCVRACPAANVGVLATTPGQAIVDDALSDGADRLTHRPDVAILALLLVFAAFANAGGMIAPVVTLEDRLASDWGLPLVVVESIWLLATLVVVPVTAVAAAASRRGSNESAPLMTIISRYAAALVPLGAAMWLAHYGFHFVTGASTGVAAAARFAGDWGILDTSPHRLVASCCAIDPPGWLPCAEIMCLDLGLLASLYFAYRIAVATFGTNRRAVRAFLPWATLSVLLFLVGVWILVTPMEMRGTLPATITLGGGG